MDPSSLSLEEDGAALRAEVVRNGRASLRVRIEVPGLRGDAQAARRIERRIGAWPGVEEARADWRSGRVLIRYNGDPRLLQRIEPIPTIPVAKTNGRRSDGSKWWSRFPIPTIRQNGGADVEVAQWHAMPAQEVLERLRSSIGGLSQAEAVTRLRAVGPNVTDRHGPRSRLSVLAGQLANLPTGILLGSSGVSMLLGDVVDAAAILAVITLNTAIGYRVERKNEELLASWEALEAGEAQVVRGGRVARVPSSEVVPGDVILIAAGDVLPADARVIEAHRLACDEAPLTGESEATDKDESPVSPDAALAERSSMLWAGTLVAAGHGRAVVTATGGARELSRVEQLVEEKRSPRAPLARRLDQLGNRVSLLALGAAGVTATAGALWGRPIGEVVRSAVALGVAAIPEGLPLVSTAALVRSMQRMRAGGMVVRRLSSAESLGGVTTICADKTGTLTLNRMQMERLDVGRQRLDSASLRLPPEARDSERIEQHPVALALAAALLNSDVEVQGRGRAMEILGSSTERALVKAAHDAGLDGAALRRAFPRRSLLERKAGTRFVVSVHDAPASMGGAAAFVKGAPEQVIELCSRDLDGPLDDEGRARVLARNEALAREGLRVLALAYRRIDATEGPSADDPPKDGFTLLGLAALRDPLRPGAADAVAAAAHAGIRTIILTGDQRRTGESIARAVGLRGEALDGADATRLLGVRNPLPLGEGRVRATETLDVDSLRARLSRIAVLSRVAPADKVAVVDALRRAGEIVAMVGDGINDAPALKAADVGVAVGVRSSDLARQVADVVMSSEDLRSILAAVGEGRIVQDNLRRSIRYLLATNLSELALVTGAALVGLPEPLTPLQLLWINLLTDSLPALALALEPGQPEVLDRPPVDPSAPLIPVSSAKRVARDGLLIAAGGALGLVVGGPAVGFSLLTGLQLGYTILCRAPSTATMTADPRFWQRFGVAAALQIPALAFPPLRSLLGLGAAPALPSVAAFAAGLATPAILSPMLGGGVIEWRREWPAPPALKFVRGPHIEIDSESPTPPDRGAP